MVDHESGPGSRTRSSAKNQFAGFACPAALFKVRLQITTGLGSTDLTWYLFDRTLAEVVIAATVLAVRHCLKTSQDCAPSSKRQRAEGQGSQQLWGSSHDLRPAQVHALQARRRRPRRLHRVHRHQLRLHEVRGNHWRRGRQWKRGLMSAEDCLCWVGHRGCGGCSGYPGIKHEPACGWEQHPDCPEHPPITFKRWLPGDPE